MKADGRKYTSNSPFPLTGTFFEISILFPVLTAETGIMTDLKGVITSQIGQVHNISSLVSETSEGTMQEKDEVNLDSKKRKGNGCPLSLGSSG